MPADPVVSVLLPTFNRAPLIARTIDRVLEQTYARCHVIVVDDGSVDATATLIADRYGSNPRVRYLYKPNGGVSSARNLALAEATGDCIAFVDSDDLWQPWKLTLQVACLQALALQGVEMIWTNMNTVDSQGRLLEPMSMRSTFTAYARCQRHGVPVFQHERALLSLVPGASDPAVDTRVHWGDAFPAMAIGNLGQTSTLLLTQRLARQAGPFNEGLRVGEDHAFNLRATRLGPAALLDVAAIDYRRGADDQLTSPAFKLPIARAHLGLIETVFAFDRDRLRLPPALLRTTLAEAHAWIGDELMQRGEHSAARRHLAQVLRLQPGRADAYWRWGLSLVPAPLLARARQGYRRLERRGSGRASSASPDTRKCPPAT